MPKSIGIVGPDGSGPCLICGGCHATGKRMVDPDNAESNEFCICNNCDAVLVTMREKMGKKAACEWIATRIHQQINKLEDALEFVHKFIHGFEK